MEVHPELLMFVINPNFRTCDVVWAPTKAGFGDLCKIHHAPFVNLPGACELIGISHADIGASVM